MGSDAYRHQLARAPLPDDVAALLDRLRAPPRLIAHLKLVHNVATQIVTGICRQWPALEFDEPGVLYGAATHDIGKILHPEELSAPGSRHEEAGALLLLQHGVSSWRAHFAWTHGQWCNVPRPLIDDLLVALADTIWSGKRNLDLEQCIAAEIGQAVGEDM
jgi:hypothetical protein